MLMRQTRGNIGEPAQNSRGGVVKFLAGAGSPVSFLESRRLSPAPVAFCLAGHRRRRHDGKRAGCAVVQGQPGTGPDPEGNREPPPPGSQGTGSRGPVRESCHRYGAGAVPRIAGIPTRPVTRRECCHAITAMLAGHLSGIATAKIHNSPGRESFFYIDYGKITRRNCGP